MDQPPRVIKRMAPTFIKPLSPPKVASPPKSPKSPKRVSPSKSPKLASPPKSPRKTPPQKSPKTIVRQKIFGGKTEGQQSEYEILKRMKTLGPLLLKDEKKPKTRDPLTKKVKKDKDEKKAKKAKKEKKEKKAKKEKKSKKKEKKQFCANIHTGQAGRKYIKINGAKVYIDKPKKSIKAAKN